MLPDKLVSLDNALTRFVTSSETQSQSHIRHLHWHIASRLVVEGGLNPEFLTPRPPLRVETSTVRGQPKKLVFDAAAAHAGEMTILGGLKTKDVDIVYSLPGIGPCIAISVKGTLGAFRNLTNRMEEAAGDCTNIHISYPNLVYGFFHVLRANRSAVTANRNDVAIDSDTIVVDAVRRYHDAISRLAGRFDVRNDVSRYEAVSLLLAQPEGQSVFPGFPADSSPISFSRFFNTIYGAYDLRYVYQAPALREKTERATWSDDSPARAAEGAESFCFRTG